MIAQQSPKKVVLADDEERILGLLQATLGGDDRFELILASDGEEALAACQSQVPDLVFLDLIMPRMDGYTVCRHLKQSTLTNGIKVVMLTAMAQDGDRRTALEIGADEYLTKPFSPIALLAKVEQLLGLDKYVPQRN
jgi:two-component system, OmpR family, alkaline phosphatase synthesis response regulator PhoP